MRNLLPLIALAVFLTGCAHQRQPKARCTGPLERINPASTPNATGAAPIPPAEAKGEGDEP